MDAQSESVRQVWADFSRKIVAWKACVEAARGDDDSDLKARQAEARAALAMLGQASWLAIHDGPRR